MKLVIEATAGPDGERLAVFHIRFEQGAHHRRTGRIVQAWKPGAFDYLDLLGFAVDVDQHTELDAAFFAPSFGDWRVVLLRLSDIFNARGNLLGLRGGWWRSWRRFRRCSQRHRFSNRLRRCRYCCDCGWCRGLGYWKRRCWRDSFLYHRDDLGRCRRCFCRYRYRCTLRGNETDDDFLGRAAGDLMNQSALQGIEKSKMEQYDEAEWADFFNTLPHLIVVDVGTAHSGR